ncbi:MAG: hypothetical protein Fur002_13090 [Anaerolineales bacterium]
MKTKIITLESHDTLISLRDKLSWAKTPRILLVVPQYEKNTLRALDLKVLQRHADSLGAQLGLVTRRPNIRREAESLGLSAFKSTAEAQRKDWQPQAARTQRVPRPPRRDLRALRESIFHQEAAWRSSLAGRVVFFTLGALSLLALAGVFLPRAEARLNPATQIQSARIPLRAGENIAEISIQGEIPARRISITLRDEQSLAISQKISVATSKAQGIARFVNLGQSELVIPQGTFVATVAEPRVRFVTLRETRIGAGSEFVETPIEAYEAGASGNVDAESIKIVEGLLGLSLTVNNPTATSGGAEALQVGASEEDRARLRQATLDALRREAETQLRAQLSADDLLLPDTLDVINIRAESFNPPAGQPGKNLTYGAQAEFSALYLSGEEMKRLALMALDSALPAGFEPVGKLRLKPLGAARRSATGESLLDLEAERSLRRRVSVMQAVFLMRGKRVETAQADLTQALDLSQPPQILITPSWWRWLPLMPFNISVQINAE